MKENWNVSKPYLHMRDKLVNGYNCNEWSLIPSFPSLAVLNQTREGVKSVSLIWNFLEKKNTSIELYTKAGIQTLPQQFPLSKSRTTNIDSKISPISIKRIWNTSKSFCFNLLIVRKNVGYLLIERAIPFFDTMVSY